jgi:predicted ATP-dependent serine protease
MLQAADRLAAPDFPVLYVSGEESPEQVRSRSVRIGAENPSLLFASETDLEKNFGSGAGNETPGVGGGLGSDGS